ncbi:XylR N-terminal domain-containing protein [Candidatus Latescibacterota bacterium]
MRVEDLHHRELLELDPEGGGVIRFAGQRALLLDTVAMGLLRQHLVESFGLKLKAAIRVTARSGQWEKTAPDLLWRAMRLSGAPAGCSSGTAPKESWKREATRGGGEGAAPNHERRVVTCTAKRLLPRTGCPALR